MRRSPGAGGGGGQGAGWEAESVVERDRGGECEEAADQTGAQAVEGASAVAFEGEEVLGGPVDRLDALADRSEVQSLAGFVLAARTMDAGVHGSEVGLELR